jgi:hypothetical protein
VIELVSLIVIPFLNDKMHRLAANSAGRRRAGKNLCGCRRDAEAPSAQCERERQKAGAD